MDRTFSELSLCIQSVAWGPGPLQRQTHKGYHTGLKGESFKNMRRLTPTGGFASVCSDHVGMSEEWENEEIKE